MLAMKLWALAPVLACGRAGRRGSSAEPEKSVVWSAPRTSDAALELDECTQVASEFLDAPVSREQATEKAMDYCVGRKGLAERSYACPHFKEAVERALELEPPERRFDASSFCAVAEAYMLTLRGASRVPRTGSGPLVDFEVSPKCEKAVASTFAPAKELDSAHVPDFWYAMCMNQDCAHFLPSRTRWCNIQRQPTHSVVVCKEARKFAIDEIAVHEAGKMGASQICALYGEFVKEMGIDVEAYEHVMHFDSTRRVPRPSDQDFALQSSRLVNTVTQHRLRDGEGSQAEQEERGGTGRAAAPLAGLLALAALLQADVSVLAACA